MGPYVMLLLFGLLGATNAVYTALLCSIVNILYKGNLGSFTPISLKFCQPTSYGLVSYGFKRHYDPSIFRHIFI